MAAFTIASVGAGACCPICGERVFTVGAEGQVEAADVHPIPLYRRDTGEGYSVCDDCGFLAQLPEGLTIN
jgi:hypothetical protein